MKAAGIGSLICKANIPYPKVQVYMWTAHSVYLRFHLGSNLKDTWAGIWKSWRSLRCHDLRKMTMKLQFPLMRILITRTIRALRGNVPNVGESSETNELTP